MADTLPMWTVFEKPTDFPDKFVARKFVIEGTQATPTDEHVLGDTLEEVRSKIPAGLVRITRFPDDEPQIVEVWL